MSHTANDPGSERKTSCWRDGPEAGLLRLSEIDREREEHTADGLRRPR